MDFFRRKIAPAIARPGRWLDAGCGSGFFSRLLANRERHFTGLDASTPMINSARRLAKRYGLSDMTQFETVADLDRLSFADGSFAGCICLSVIEYLDRPYQCLDELARVIEPGGFLIVSVPHANSPLRFAQRLADRRFRWSCSGAWSYLSVSKFETTPPALEKAFFERGFKVKEMFEFDPLIPAPLLRVFPPSLIFAIAVKNGVTVSERTVERDDEMESRRTLFARRFWCNRFMKGEKRRRYRPGYAASVAFQISGARFSLMPRLPSLNSLFRIRCMSSIPTIVLEAVRNRFNRNVGRKRSLRSCWHPWTVSKVSSMSSVMRSGTRWNDSQ
ncbi:class I SAM-dependent methyltransferase [Methylosinus sp. H3A]|uniref:class I SAM-dependent methyltransferase n=1 Tax=Methylosinus sp. H3A TaxID=2785786 RepID=UPI00391752D4